MGVFLALGLLMLKDLRTIFRRKASFIIELIILILTLVIIGLLCFVMHAKGSAGLPSKHYPIWTAADSKSYYVRMTNGFNITEEAYVISWLQRACPMYDFNGKKDQKDLLTTLWLKDFKVTGKPEEHRLYYEITGFDEVNFGLPATKVHGGIFGEPRDTYKDGDVKQEVLFLQSCINRAFLEQHRGPDAAPIPLLATGTMPPATPGMFYMMIGTLMSMSILIVILLALREIATEKESGIHAYMLAVGLPRWTFFTSHYIFATVKTSVFFFVAFIIIAAFGKPILSIRIIYTVAVYAQVVIAFTMMIAALVKRNLYVTLATIAYVFMGTVLKNALSVTVFQQTKAMLFSFLHPGCALGFILEHFDKAESYNKPVRIFAGYSEYMPVAPPFIFMYLQYFFFMVMTYYIDYVVPTDDTPKLHPLFFFGLGKKEADEPDTEEKGESKEKEQNSRHEEIQATGELQLEVKDLVKKWPNGDVAVNKISFKVHSGQVVALLGHNGAGKSTTFSCLTGFLKPTSGTIKLVNGGRVGYCPQWDPLFTHLTVKEHLVFYCKLFTGSAPDQEVLETTLEKIELNNAAGTLAKNLSGGMKRKLSLGIALISSAKVVLLDEPTAGIDTFARRNMVKVIEKAKADHAVVITTHYMDEADALSDHINIMAHGEIICSGSSEFLKSKFGTGIMLVVDLDLSHREKMDVITKCANEILDVVKKSCPDAEFYGPVASQLSIVIGAKNRPAFPQLFADLESKSAELKIESFDVNMNSLDQVFVNVTKQSEGGEIKADEEIMKFIEKRKECDRGTFLFLTQIKALFIRKFHNFRRDYFQIGVVCVALFLIITSTIMKKAMKDDDEPVKSFNLSAKATAKLDPADFFKFNVELFPVGDENDIKSQMTSYLSSSYDIAAYENDDSEDIPAAYKKIQNSRWKVPTPTMFFLLNATVSLAMINPGFYHAEYLAQHMFFESFAPGLITGQITYKPVMWGPDSGVHPTFTPEDKKSKDQSITILLLVYPLIFALPVFLYTTERVEGAVHLYARTHLTKFTYWVTSFLSEFVVFTTFSLVIAFVLFSSSFWHISCLGPFILITLLLSLAFIAQSYAASQIFNSSGVTFTMLMIWNFAIFMIMNLVIELISTKFEPIIYARFLMPSLALFTLFGRMDMHCSAKTTLETILECGEGCKLHPLALIGGCTAIHLAVFIGVLVYPRILACFTKKVNDTSTATDTPDVTKERERVEQGGVGKHAVVAIGLKKTFGLIWKKKTVVRNITFGVSKNECFGLLGSNGAGKSTTFNMLTASLRPTAGKAYVGGTSVANSPEFGFCPQKESILMELTVYETLLLFARLSGINETHEVAKLVMNCLQLSTRKDVLVRRCSGGEKRRVSIGVALITDPNILMLDEPTAGVDPHTRRFVWETLLTLKNTGASMILTSHSMEECEALCTRIAFLTGGNMIALGTSQHLKHTLGNEYVLTVSLTGPNEKLVEELNKRFKEAFEAEGENDATDINLRYIFKKKDQKMSVLYTKLDEIVASASETSSAANSNAPKTSSAQPSSNAPQPSSGAPSAEKTQPGTEGGGKKEKNGVRECIIVGATLEDIFIRLAQSGAPIPKAVFEK